MRLFVGKNHEDATLAPVQSIFRLVGSDEDALTYALGFLAAYDPMFCEKLVRRCGVRPRRSFRNDYTVHLQEVTDARFGRRDIVIEAHASKLRIVLEAKVGNAEPTSDQLLKYANDDQKWVDFSTRVIVALTQVELTSATRETVKTNLESKQIALATIQWHQICELAMEHASSRESDVSRYLFDEFVGYIRRDYDMGYYDAEILVADTDPVNAPIFEEGWMFLTWHNNKKAPLYIAPYFTHRKSDSGVSMISRVMNSETVRVAEHIDMFDGGTGEHRERWRVGLELMRRRAEDEGFGHELSQIFYLDRPIAFRSQPLTKKAFNATMPDKQMPSRLPIGYSLRFDELLDK